MATTNPKTTTTTAKNQGGNRNVQVRERPTARPNVVTHTEFVSRDPAATREFFEQLFGWQFNVEAGPGGDYHMVRFEETQTGGGIRAPQKAEAPSAIPYVEVEDLAEAERTAKQNGAKILQPRTAMGDNGSLLVLQAPGGPLVGLWAPTN